MKRAVLVIAILLAAVACKKEDNDNATSTTDTTATATTTASTTGTSGAPSSAAVTLNDKDKDFVTKAGKAGKAEVALAQDAVAHAADPDVKAFAQKLVDDHTKANDQLSQIASTKGVTVPSEVEDKITKTKERLEKLTGKNFDQAFVHQMIEDHTDAIKLFDDASKDAADADVKQFATSTLPTLHDHLTAAQNLQKKIGKR